MISSTADYAIRALLLLARQPEGRLVRAEEIAEAIGAPRNYLAKTMYGLAKAGLVSSMRGPAGGFALAVPADRLTLARVADLFDDATPNPRCLLGNRPCDLTRPCAVHDRWVAVVGARRAPLVGTTIADLLGEAAAPGRVATPARAARTGAARRR